MLVRRLLRCGPGCCCPDILPFFCWMVAIGFCSYPARSQDTRLTITFEKSTLDQALIHLRTVSGTSIAFNTDEIRTIGIAAISYQDRTVEEILQSLAETYGLSIEKKGQVFLVTRTVNTTATAGKMSYQPVTVTGYVRELSGKSPIPNVTVTLKGSKQAVVTDAGGFFTIRVPDEKAVLVFTHTGFERVEQKVDTHGPMQISLTRRSAALEAVTVEARRKLNTEAQLLNERRISAVVSDAISAQNIEKTASITTTQALQRVTGVTITDDKYVAIRGLGDRSVISELNGARLSSANPDRSAVPLDLVPAALLDNVTVYKTLSPDHPADASAGIIELKTKSVPDSLHIEFTAQTGFNSGVGIEGKFNAFTGFTPGFLAENISRRNLAGSFLALSQEYPGGTNQIASLMANSRNTQAMAAEANRINNIMLSLPPVATTSFQSAQPNQIYSVSAGNSYNLGGNRRLGVILGLAYYVRTENRYHAELNQYSIYEGVLTGTPQIFSAQHIPNYITPDYVRLGKYLGYQENTGTETINYGGLAGLTYRFDSRNEIQLQYVGSRGGEVGGSSLTGAYDNTGLGYAVLNQVNQLSQSYRIFNTFNLQGEHRFVNRSWSPRLSYNVSSSVSSQDDPDFRFSDVADAHKVSFADPNGAGVVSDYYAFVVGSVHGIGPTDSIIADPNGRRFRHLRETNYNIKADLTEPFTVSGKQQTLKFGVNFLQRNRTYQENVLGFPGTDSTGDNGLLQQVHGDLSALVSYKNIGLSSPANYDQEGAARTVGYLYQIRKSPNNYTGSYSTGAFYGMLDAHLSDRLRLIGGLRFENTHIVANVDTSHIFDAVTNSDVSANLNPNTSYDQGFKPFYSGNLVYAYRHNMNFRLAFSTSLARPELREITNIYEFDPFQFAVVVGNPNLVNQTAANYDFRWEWFPRSNEVFAVSAFYKEIHNQLTKVFVYNTPGTEAQSPEFPIVEFINDPDVGKVYGLELEARKDMGVSGLPFHHLFIGTNALIDYSVITKNPDRLDKDRIVDRQSSAKSPIFEQAPYAINAYLDYDNPRTGTDITTSFNIVGERLVQIQLDGSPDIYDRPVPVLDVVFSQRFWRRFVVKGFAKNLLDPPYREVYADPRNHGKFYGQTYIHHQYYRGTEFLVGLTYNLF